MTDMNFQAHAELYLGSDWHQAAAQGPRAFPTAAQAIRFAMEEAAPVSLHGARLKVGTTIVEGEALKWLYRSPDYPLPRKRLSNTAWAIRPRAVPFKESVL